MAVVWIVTIVAAHDGMDFENVAQPAFSDGIQTEFDGGIVAVDVGKLQRQFVFLADSDELFEISK